MTATQIISADGRTHGFAPAKILFNITNNAHSQFEVKLKYVKISDSKGSLGDSVPQNVSNDMKLRSKEMETEKFLKAVVDADINPVVICDLSHTIVYMNPCAVQRYAKKGGAELVGRSIFDCHNDHSNEMILKVFEWFKESSQNNRIFTFHNPKENKDVYITALRDENGSLIGYYEKHEVRTSETCGKYSFN